MKRKQLLKCKKLLKRNNMDISHINNQMKEKRTNNYLKKNKKIRCCKNCCRLYFYDNYYCKKEREITSLSNYCKNYKKRNKKFWLNLNGDF